VCFFYLRGQSIWCSARAAQTTVACVYTHIIIYVYTLDLLDHVVDVDAADHLLDDRTRFVGVRHRRWICCDRATVGRSRRHHRVARRQRIAPGASHFAASCPAFGAAQYNLLRFDLI